jgi:hypothetical protein
MMGPGRGGGFGMGRGGGGMVSDDYCIQYARQLVFATVSVNTLQFYIRTLYK